MAGGVGNGKGRMGEECSMCGWWPAVIRSNEYDARFSNEKGMTPRVLEAGRVLGLRTRY
jgi:hypothetical protein